ncbi:MAG: DUF89 family protein [Clostridia bacterium]|nr:DUF89 family protein [Clostridia bacterium]
MNHIKLNPECVRCLLNKHILTFPKGTSRETQLACMQQSLRILADAPLSASAPEVLADVTALRRSMGVMDTDLAAVKRRFNTLMLTLAPDIARRIDASPDPLRAAVGFAMTGNYIDFGAMDSVDENKLHQLLAGADSLPFDEAAFTSLRGELASAGKMVYITDNCGEIVLDKLLAGLIRRLYPSLDVTFLVRGEPVMNDATLEDAAQVGLSDTAWVISNGSGAAGTVLARISEEARALLESADLILAKGQGNFETLYYCELNVYYLFMCKCPMFADRFGVPRFSGMLLREAEIGRWLG